MINFEKYHLEITNPKAIKLIKILLYIAFFICLIGVFLLWIYNNYYCSIYLYKCSLIIFRTGLLTGVFSIICGIFFSNYNYLK